MSKPADSPAAPAAGATGSVPMRAPSFETIAWLVEHDIARITLNRPERLNALNDAMFREIPQAIALSAQARARALLITGAGRGFCSGADLVGRPVDRPAPTDDDLVSRSLTPPDADRARALRNRQAFEPVLRLIRALHEAPMPVVCAVNGVAAGGGVGIALAGDIVLMAEDARFVLTFVPRLGLVPDVGATWLMSRLAGRARALGASLLGDAISARQAERWGLVWQLVPVDRLEAEALAICRRLADGPQAAAIGTRRLIDRAPAMSLPEHSLVERDEQAALLGGPDFIEGVLAFREKRPVRFTSGH